MVRRIKTILYAYTKLVTLPNGCHQLPERSFSHNNNQFPVCARCTGVSVGHVAGIILTIFLVYLGYFNEIKLFFFGLFLFIPMGIDWSLQFFFNFFSTNKRRLITGLICGIGAGILYVLIVKYLFLLTKNFLIVNF